MMTIGGDIVSKVETPPVANWDFFTSQNLILLIYRARGLGSSGKLRFSNLSR